MLFIHASESSDIQYSIFSVEAGCWDWTSQAETRTGWWKPLAADQFPLPNSENSGNGPFPIDTVPEMLPLFYHDFRISFIASIMIYLNFRWFYYHFPLFLSIAMAFSCHFCELGAAVSPWESTTPTPFVAKPWDPWQAEHPLFKWLEILTLLIWDIPWIPPGNWYKSRFEWQNTTITHGFSSAMFDFERVI